MIQNVFAKLFTPFISYDSGAVLVDAHLMSDDLKISLFAQPYGRTSHDAPTSPNGRQKSPAETPAGNRPNTVSRDEKSRKSEIKLSQAIEYSQ